ncbi:hypothetical protein [Desulfobacula toluolica]|uniref:Uncharacterized protein n=1 Tax=Desulfobacula toluolica (strain DSM 7467 / Tol2) TaxID=651182 RepID=K0NKB3_DESTT|nr:hypothetical protein [Desulfobacula toluolica]CCK81285.1 uncharacterized protein TOL2_C31270 [Desulfobacula toluolica Tol2]
MDKKKLAAAISAVFACIKTSEEAAAYSVSGAYGSVPETGAQQPQIMQPNNIWGISGRQTHMQANSMMQLRMFK